MRQSTPSAKAGEKNRIRLFGGLRTLALSSLLVALSIVLGKYAAVNIGDSFRLSLENLPVLLAGVFAGPIIGGLVGCVADLIGCVLVGYAINPIITLGATLVGVVSGLMARYVLPRSKTDTCPPWRIVVSVYSAHIVGSMAVKSLGMWVYYGTPPITLLWRVPIYLVTGVVESGVLIILSRSRLFMGELNKITHGRTS